ncbi:hypothetical protein AGOR_G00032100 [Albula goreensis]|uniref:Uncharacterized protein n=1 Tax=Albula goreensis TaxID=1534307 RepID=A0A8T3DZI2_9TELE|nr:hypothetical protein AGOR_G00032100 [Albula goreensis]
MALENSVFAARPESLSLPVSEKRAGPEEEQADPVASAGSIDTSEELGRVVTTDTAVLPQPPANRSFQSKLAAREAQAAARPLRKKNPGSQQREGQIRLGAEPA